MILCGALETLNGDKLTLNGMTNSVDQLLEAVYQKDIPGFVPDYFGGQPWDSVEAAAGFVKWNSEFGHVKIFQFWLWVKRIDVAWPAIHK